MIPFLGNLKYKINLYREGILVKKVWVRPTVNIISMIHTRGGEAAVPEGEFDGSMGS